MVLVLVTLLASTTAVWQKQLTAASPAVECGSLHELSYTMRNGSLWEMCWEVKEQEGIVLSNITYTPPAPFNTPRLVLKQASLGQIHVAYDSGSPRYNFVSDEGLGGDNLLDLAPADCPDGNLLTDNAKDVVCLAERARGYVYKQASASVHPQGTQLNFTSISRPGSTYLVDWIFVDDGAILPAVGLTGELSELDTTAEHGWPIGPGNTNYAESSTHNYFWRLDFDIAGSTNDFVETMEFTNSGSAARPVSRTTLTTEGGLLYNPLLSRSWRVVDSVLTNTDNHQLSYHILPNADHIFRGTAAEPFTNFDLYVTKYNACEQFASNNPTAGGCGANLAQFANGESLANQDVVVWVRGTYHHVPRDEDAPYLSTRWSKLTLYPHDMTASNPLTGINIGDFAISANPTERDTCGSAVVNYALALGRTNGYNQPITLSLVNTPAGADVTFTPNPVPSLPNNASLTIDTDGVAPGNYPLMVRGVNGSLIHVEPIILKVGAAPVTPALVSPTDGLFLDTLTPTLVWNEISGATGYDVQIASDFEFNNILHTISNVATTETVTPALPDDMTLYWRVRANTACGSSAYSTPFSFITPDFAHSVTPNATQATGAAGELVQYQLLLENTGSAADSYTISLSGQEWTTTVQPMNVNLTIGGQVNLQLEVAIPPDATAGAADEVTVHITPASGVPGSTAVVTTTVEQTPFAYAIGIFPFSLTGQPGETLVYSANLQNQGSVTDTYVISVTNNSWPTTWEIDEITLPEGTEVTFAISVTVPATATYPMSDTFTFNVDPAGADPSGSLDATSYVTNPYSHTVLITPPAQNDTAGNTVVYTVTLTNVGEITHTYSLSLTEAVWDSSLSLTEVTLEPEESSTFTISVTIPATATYPMSDTFTLEVAPEVGLASSHQATTSVTMPPLTNHIYLPILTREE